MHEINQALASHSPFAATMERWHGEVQGTQVFEPDALALHESL